MTKQEFIIKFLFKYLDEAAYSISTKDAFSVIDHAGIFYDKILETTSSRPKYTLPELSS